MPARVEDILQHQLRLRACALCPRMTGPVVTCSPVVTPILLVGQAPGDREGPAGRPFAWTAGKTLFKWFESIGVDEARFRQHVYMAAVCRCFPGKNPKGGDRMPSKQEIANCSRWLHAEIDMQHPRLIIAVGKLAIEQFMPAGKLADLVGKVHGVEVRGRAVDLAPLPHPSGLSTWFKVEPGKTLLARALELIHRHPAWRGVFE